MKRNYHTVSAIKSLNVNKSIWRGHVKRPQTPASEDTVPVIVLPQLEMEKAFFR